LVKGPTDAVEKANALVAKIHGEPPILD